MHTAASSANVGGRPYPRRKSSGAPSTRTKSAWPSPAPGLRERQRMIRAQAPAAGAVHEDRHAGGLGEGGQSLGGVVPPHATAGHDDRALSP